MALLEPGIYLFGQLSGSRKVFHEQFFDTKYSDYIQSSASPFLKEILQVLNWGAACAQAERFHLFIILFNLTGARHHPGRDALVIGTTFEPLGRWTEKTLHLGEWTEDHITTYLMGPISGLIWTMVDQPKSLTGIQTAFWFKQTPTGRLVVTIIRRLDDGRARLKRDLSGAGAARDPLTEVSRPCRWEKPMFANGSGEMSRHRNRRIINLQILTFLIHYSRRQRVRMPSWWIMASNSMG